MAAKKTSKRDAWTPSPPDHRAPRRVRPEGQTNLVQDKRRHGLWVERQGSGDRSEVVETPYDQGWISGTVQVWAQGSLVHTWSAVPDPSRAPEGPGGGQQEWTLPNGATVTTFGGALRVGWERRYLSDGALFFERFFDERGLQQGVERRWDHEGGLIHEHHYRDGLREGPQRERQHDGSYLEQDFVAGQRAIPPRTEEALLRRLRTASDRYEVGTALRKVVSTLEEEGLAWSLVRRGAWDPLELRTFAGLEYLALRGTRDVAWAQRLVRGGAAHPALDRQHAMLPGWPVTLDELIWHAYDPADDARWAAFAAELPPAQATGVHFVRGRQGAALEPQAADAVLDALAGALVLAHAAIANPLPFRDDAGQMQTLRVETTPQQMDLLVARFGSEARFAGLLGPWVRTQDKVYPYRVAALVKRCQPDDLAALLARLQLLQARPLELLGVRQDLDLADWTRVADALWPAEGPALRHDAAALAETVFILAARAARREGAALPEALDRLVTATSPRWTSWSAGPLVGDAELREALETLPPARVQAICARLLERPYDFPQISPVLAVAPSEALLRLVAERIEGWIQPHSEQNELIYYAADLGRAGSAVMPLLRRLWQTGRGPLRTFARLALIAALAQEARQGRTPPEDLDELIDTHVEGLQMDESFAEPFLGPALATLAAALPAPRAEAALLRAADPGLRHWGAALRLVPWATTTRALAAAGGMLGQRVMALQARNPHLTAMIADLGDAAALSLAELAQGAHPGQAALIPILREALPEAQRADFDAAVLIGHDGASAEGETLSLGARVTALSASLSLPKLPIYLLEPTEELAKRGLTRAGGKAIGVSEEAWPECSGEPMQHVLTLDLDELPLMRTRRAALAGARALAVFVPNRETGESNDQGTIRLLSQADVETHGERGRVPFGERARRIQVTPVEVPEMVFLPEERWDAPGADLGTLTALRDLISGAPGRALGRPCWLQGDYNDYEDDEREGRFLLQLDERLVELNLGDSGILYVFEDAVCDQSC